MVGNLEDLAVAEDGDTVGGQREAIQSAAVGRMAEREIIIYAI